MRLQLLIQNGKQLVDGGTATSVDLTDQLADVVSHFVRRFGFHRCRPGNHELTRSSGSISPRDRTGDAKHRLTITLSSESEGSVLTLDVSMFS